MNFKSISGFPVRGDCGNPPPLPPLKGEVARSAGGVPFTPLPSGHPPEFTPLSAQPTSPLLGETIEVRSSLPSGDPTEAQPVRYPQGVCRIRSAAKLLTAALFGSVGEGGDAQ